MAWRIYRIARQGKPCPPKRMAEHIEGETAEAALAAFHEEFPWYPLAELRASRMELVKPDRPELTTQWAKEEATHA